MNQKRRDLIRKLETGVHPMPHPYCIDFDNQIARFRLRINELSDEDLQNLADRWAKGKFDLTVMSL